jgi:CMP-N-acetylneuraminic acid synthetase
MSVRVLAIVPARGGSKGVPRKNLRHVGGTTLLERAVRSVRAADGVDAVLVSTEDVEIATAARAAGAAVPFMRPAELASDTASTVDVLVHALETWTRSEGVAPEWFVLAEPTNPFRRSQTVAAAVARAMKGDVASVIAVCSLERKPQYIFTKVGDLLDRYIKEPREQFGRRQEMAHLCRLSGVVWVVRTSDFLLSRHLLMGPTAYVSSDGFEAINIDELLDLEFANFVAARFGL